MIKNLTQKFFAVLLAAMIIIPLGTLMAATETGNVVIKVVDQDDKAFSGTWRMHRGMNSSGIIRRNGNSGEDFTFEAGTYFLVAFPKDKHRHALITSENPQEVKADGKTTFTVKYFLSEDAYKKAKAKMIADLKEAKEAAEAKKAVEAKKTEKKTSDEAAKKGAETKKVTKKAEPQPEETISDAELIKAKEEKARKRNVELAMRQKAAQLAREKAGTGNVANAAQRKAAENKANKVKTDTSSSKEEKKEDKKEDKKEEKKSAEKTKEADKKEAKKTNAEKIREAAALRASLKNVPKFDSAPKKAAAKTAVKATSTKKNPPKLAETGSPALLALMIPSLMGGFIFRKRK